MALPYKPPNQVDVNRGVPGLPSQRPQMGPQAGQQQTQFQPTQPRLPQQAPQVQPNLRQPQPQIGPVQGGIAPGKNMVGQTMVGPQVPKPGQFGKPPQMQGDFNLDKQFDQLLAQQKMGLADTMTGIDRDTSLNMRRQANMNAELGRGMGGGFSGGMGQVQLGSMDQRRQAQQDSYKQGLEMKMAYIDRALRVAEANKDRTAQMELQKQADATALAIAGLQFGEDGGGENDAGGGGGGGSDIGGSMSTGDMAIREGAGGAMGYGLNQAANQFGALAQGPGGQMLAAGPLAPMAGLAAIGSAYDDQVAKQVSEGDYYNAGGQALENVGESAKGTAKKIGKRLGF